jgi:hypothetical protein
LLALVHLDHAVRLGTGWREAAASPLEQSSWPVAALVTASGESSHLAAQPRERRKS